MRYEQPAVVDHGSIAAHTFSRCASGDPSPDAPPKDFEDFPLDNFGECSSGHVS